MAGHPSFSFAPAMVGHLSCSSMTPSPSVSTKGQPWLLAGPGFRRAFIFFIIDTIFVRIRYRTSLVTGKTGYSRAFIFFIIDTVFIRIRNRTTFILCKTRHSGTFIQAIDDTIFIRINSGGAGGNGFKAGSFFLPILPAIPNWLKK